MIELVKHSKWPDIELQKKLATVCLSEFQTTEFCRPPTPPKKKHYARNQSFDEPTRIGIQLKVHVLRSILSAFL